MTNTTTSIFTPASAVRTPSQLREHYEIEKELAARLRAAGQAERRTLYHSVYDERLRRIPAHPLITRSHDPAARQKAMALQLRLVLWFLPPGGVYLEIGPGDWAVALAMARHARRV